MNQRWLPIALLVLVGGCGDLSLPSRYAAASVAGAFIRAARSGDRAAVEAYIDWPAVRSDIVEQLAKADGASPGMQLAADDPDGGAADRMIDLSNFHFRGPPGSFGGMVGAAHLAAMVRPAGEGRLCLSESVWKTACVLTLAHEKTGWKVVGISLGLLRSEDEHTASI